MTDFSQFAQGMLRQQAAQQALRGTAQEQELFRQPTQEELDREQAENAVFRGKAEKVRERINAILKEEGLVITVIDHGDRVVLADEEYSSYLDIFNGTWH